MLVWRYQLFSFLKIFSLSIASFCLVLIVSRFKEIARFAALSSDLFKTLIFFSYQIPNILPLAFPISALAASFLLFQNLSKNSELIALRTSGLSLRQIAMPVLLCAFCLACLNFSITSGLTPFCMRESKVLLYSETSMNPLLLLQRKDLVKIKDAYLKMEVKDCRKVEDFFLIVRNSSQDSLQFFSAKKLKIHGDELLGFGSTILTHLMSEEVGFDPLIIENQREMLADAPILSLALKKHRPKLDPGSMSLWMLQMRAKEQGKKGRAAHIEIVRRLSLVIAVFTFTILGASFGITSRRSPSKRGVLYVLFLSLFVLMTYLGLKAIKMDVAICWLCMLMPHVVILFVSMKRLIWIARGKT